MNLQANAMPALRSDLASQRQAQTGMLAARARFIAHPTCQALIAELTQYSGGLAIEECPALDELFAPAGAGRDLVSRWTETMLPALAEEPLGVIPFRHQYSGGIAVMQLAEAGSAVLSLVSIEGEVLHDRPAAQTLCFTDCDRHEIVLAGEGEARTVKLTNSAAPLHLEANQLRKGTRTSMSGPNTTRIIDRVWHRLVALRLSRTPANAVPTREFRLSDGALVHQASADRRASRNEMFLATLGRMGRADAAPVMAEMALEGAGEGIAADADHLRWEALRECLALDTASGFATLCLIAADSVDLLAPHAGALRAQLLESHPQLAQLEVASCPA